MAVVSWWRWQSGAGWVRVNVGCGCGWFHLVTSRYSSAKRLEEVKNLCGGSLETAEVVSTFGADGHASSMCESRTQAD